VTSSPSIEAPIAAATDSFPLLPEPEALDSWLMAPCACFEFRVSTLAAEPPLDVVASPPCIAWENMAPPAIAVDSVS
jgi:hypothetical protein